MKYTYEQKKEHTRQFQHFLHTIHQYTGDIPDVDMNGIYSDKLKETVALYQKKRGLPITGLGDRDTWHSAYEEQQSLLDLYGTSIPIKVFPDGTGFILRTGSTGGIVYIIQVMLNAITPHFNNLSPIAYTGKMDDATTRQISLLQHTASYPETGEIDKKTWDLLAIMFNNYANRKPTKFSD